MNIFPQPCAAPSESARLGAKQGHATSAKVATDSTYQPPSTLRTFKPSHLFTIQYPRASVSRKRGGNFNIQNPRASASRERGSLTPSSLNSTPRLRPDRRRGLTPRRPAAAFTLIELMAATTVLSIILLMMVGMQDQMSKAWSNSNRRTDATREARAACRLMAQDLSGLVFRRTNNNTADSIPAELLKNGVPFLYSSNGAGNLITIPNPQTNASYFFGISSRKASGANPGDLAIVGYYIASAITTNVSGFVTTNYNLYRHYVPASNAVNNLNTWFSSTTKDAKNLFNPTNAEILARNTCNLRVTFYNRQDPGGKYAVTNGLNYSFESGGTATYFSGNKIQVEISVYPEDFAQKIPYADWGKSENIRKFARSYEFRIDIPRE